MGKKFKKGQSGNPKGRPKGATNNALRELRKQLQVALDVEGEAKGTTFLKHVAEQAYKDKNVLQTVLGKLLPDLKSVDATVKSDGLTLTIICSRKPKWQKKDTK